MAKGIRSKSKKANRTEFRKTIGEDFAQKQMALVQANLQQCIEKGSMNSFEKLSNQLNGDNKNSSNHFDDDYDNNNVDNPNHMDVMDMDMNMDKNNSSKTDTNTNIKRSDKMPAAKSKTNKKRKQYLPKPIGQTGAKLAVQKMIKMKRRGQWNTKPKKRKTRRSFI